MVGHAAAKGKVRRVRTAPGGYNELVEVVAVSAVVVGAVGIAVWLGLLLWAAREDGRAQRRAEARERRRQAGRGSRR